MPQHNSSMVTTTLRPQLKTALMRQLSQSPNRKKGLLQKGFTLVELMVVIVIVGILTGIALPNFLSQQQKAKRACAETQVSGIAKEQQVYFAENGSFAADNTALGATIPAACNGYSALTVSATAVSASPTDTTNGYCVKATLANGAYTISRNTKGACT